MHGRLAALMLVMLGTGAALVLSQCFAPTFHDCGFRCGTVAPQCPDEYECRSDNYCHLRDSSTDGFCVAPDLGGLGVDAASGG